MSADPTTEHIDAVARVAAGLLDDFDTVMNVRLESREITRRILTSTDPAVHAALAASLPAEVMLAALVDRGTLTEEAEDIIGFHDETCPDPCPFGKRRRLATPWTPWEVAP